MNVQNFLNETFGKVRCIIDEEGIWFLAADVATILGYVNPRDAIIRHTFASDRKTLRYKDGECSQLWSGKDYADKMLINESGLYCLIFGSKMPAAEEFKRWVTSTVIPSIRENGGYIEGQENLEQEDLEKVKETLAELHQEVQRLTANKSKLTSTLSWTEDRMFQCQDELAEILKVIARLPDEIQSTIEYGIRRSQKEAQLQDRFCVLPNGLKVAYTGYQKNK